MKKLFLGLMITAHLVSAECANMDWIVDHLTTVEDFPEPGVTFKWMGPLMRDSDAFQVVIDTFAERYEDVDAVVALDARGFVFGAPLALAIKRPLILVRKKGKIPGETISIPYEREYGAAEFEIETCALEPGQRVVVIDDLIATGGTAVAACKLVEALGAEVAEVAVMIELPFLEGRENLERPLYSLVQING